MEIRLSIYLATLDIRLFLDILWKREWQSTPVFLPGEFHGQRSVADDSPWGHKESDMTEELTLPLLTQLWENYT